MLCFLLFSDKHRWKLHADVPDSAKLVVTAYVKQESHWAVQASMFSFWKERSRIWINLKLWHCSYWVCVGPIDFIHQKQCLRMNGWKPPILLCTFTLESDGTLLIDLICQLLGLEKRSVARSQHWWTSREKMSAPPVLEFLIGHESHLAFDSDVMIFHDPQLDLKDLKAQPLNFELKGPVTAVTSWDLLSDSFWAFTESSSLKLFKPYISWRDQPGIRTSTASFISFPEQCIIFWEELRNSHCFVSRTVPQCSRLFQIVAKSSQRWKSEGGAADLQEGVEPSKISHCRVCLCQSQFWQQIT